MELDDLKNAWQSLDQRLAAQQALTLSLVRNDKLGRARSALRPLFVSQWIKLAVGIAVCFLFAPFWVAHRHTLHLMVPGLLLHVFGVMYIIDAVRELGLLGGVDYTQPVLTIQKRLALYIQSNGNQPSTSAAVGVAVAVGNAQRFPRACGTRGDGWKGVPQARQIPQRRTDARRRVNSFIEWFPGEAACTPEANRACALDRPPALFAKAVEYPRPKSLHPQAGLTDSQGRGNRIPE